MKIRHVAVAGAAAAAAAAVAVLPWLSLALGAGSAPSARAAERSPEVAPAAAQAVEFEVDGVHSSVIFRIEHNGVAPFYGAFKDIDGTFALDANDPSASAFNVRIKASSVDTRNGGRDRHLKGHEFFDADKHHDITFKSTGAEKSGDPRALKVSGDLTLRGVTRPITADMKVWPLKETSQGPKAGFEAVFTIKRSDFGMDAYVANGGLGDEVTITVACEGKKKE